MPRPGQRFAFIMDTRQCDGAEELADGADLLVAESTFRDDDAALAANTAPHRGTGRRLAAAAAACGGSCSPTSRRATPT